MAGDTRSPLAIGTPTQRLPIRKFTSAHGVALPESAVAISAEHQLCCPLLVAYRSDGFAPMAFVEHARGLIRVCQHCGLSFLGAKLRDMLSIRGRGVLSQGNGRQLRL